MAWLWASGGGLGFGFCASAASSALAVNRRFQQFAGVSLLEKTSGIQKEAFHFFGRQRRLGC